MSGREYGRLMSRHSRRPVGGCVESATIISLLQNQTGNRDRRRLPSIRPGITTGVDTVKCGVLLHAGVYGGRSEEETCAAVGKVAEGEKLFLCEGVDAG